MAAAVALRKDSAFEHRDTGWSREEVLARYRHLQAISARFDADLTQLISPDAVLHHARRLGLADGKLLLIDDPDDLIYAIDLAIHTAPPGRSRVIDRYARSARLAPGSDEALVLEAMRHARFALLRVERRHEAAGIVVTDLTHETDHWLVDEGLESPFRAGLCLATRLYEVDRFAIAADVLVPVDRRLVEDVFDEAPYLYRKPAAEAVVDRRFAEALYRVALADGVTMQVADEDTSGPIE